MIGLFSIAFWMLCILLAISIQERDDTTKFYRGNSYARLALGEEEVLVLDATDHDLETGTIAESIIDILKNGADIKQDNPPLKPQHDEQSSLLDGEGSSGYGSFSDADTAAQRTADVEAARAVIEKRRRDDMRSV
jgi:hypothetical protein